MRRRSFIIERPELTDPLAEIVTFLKPRAPYSKWVTAAGAWRVRREEIGHVFYCMMLDGRISLTVDGEPPLLLEAGDFVLVPSSFGFTTQSVDETADDDASSKPVFLDNGALRLGRIDGPPDSQYLVGHCVFGSPDADLLVALLPKVVVVRRDGRLEALARLLRDETLARRPARDIVLERLLEVLFIEALRSTAASDAAPCLLRGLGDPRLAQALRALHQAPERNWSVEALAQIAALSRSTFFSRFHNTIGTPPMEYLYRWRMILAKNMLQQGTLSVAAIAERVGYGSSSAFSLAFSRYSGQAPAHFARATAKGNDPAGAEQPL
ncbi:AraC family transcriptional regulator [Martelella sp. HB161492]|uniref:AraC family transcriptional regulator n=1 Tax=Martelella sp. HB161492 TaxID=2720726 RepID=UPI001FEEBC0F|nr:AraC family transcriptional regulator [Martelella sp. HB161492]